MIIFDRLLRKNATGTVALATWPSTAKTARKRCGSYSRMLKSGSEEFRS